MSDDTMQTRLLNISKVLDDQNVKELLFLCGDKLTAKEREDIEDDANTLFLSLMKKGLVSQQDSSFLKEILYKIGRNDILTGELSMTKAELKELQNSPMHISPYRSLLYDISQQLESKDVKNVKFHVYPNKAKLKHTESMLDVLSEMEKNLFVSENNLENLKNTLALICREDLRQKIETFERQDITGRQATYLDSTQDKLPIQEKPTTQPEKQEAGSGKGMNLEHYNLDKKPHGWCVILNNEDFEHARRNKKNINNRNGTNKDADAIRKVFEKRNYTVNEYKNLTGTEMLNIMEKYQKKDHSHKDSFICFILSHGRLGIVFGVDGEEVYIKKLTSCFNGQKCPSLIGKPKVFFIQACQGDELDVGVPYEEDGCTSAYESDGGSLPNTADFLIAYASSEDYVSLRGDDGSIYIQMLCEALENPSSVQEDLKDVLTMLQKNIADKYYSVKHKKVTYDHGKQMPSYKSQLRKKLILPPENTQSN